MEIYEIISVCVIVGLFVAALISPFFVKNPKQRYKWPFRSKKRTTTLEKTDEQTEQEWTWETTCSEETKKTTATKLSKPKKHSGKCDGDCANCPPHYGYRHGRWYYGHSHIEGCVFGGNKGDGR